MSFSDRIFRKKEEKAELPRREKPFVPNLASMPKFYFRHFRKLLNLNFPMIPLWLIPLVAIYIYITAPTMTSHSTAAYTSILGANVLHPSAAWRTLLNTHGIQIPLKTFSSWRIVSFALLAVALACVWGIINTGAAYCTRSLFRKEPVFIWSDFTYAIKRNFKQAFVVGVLDFGILALLVFDFYWFSSRGGTFVLDFYFFAIGALFIIYSFMRNYLYLMLITFDIKTSKLFKNALIFSVLGIGRNLMTALGVAVLLAVNVLLFFMLLPIGVIVPILFPFFYLLPSITLWQTYGAFPVIMKYMVKSDAVVEAKNESDSEPDDNE